MPTPAEVRRQATLRREALRSMSTAGPLPTARKLAEKFGVDKNTILRDLRAIGHVAPADPRDSPRGAPASPPGRDAAQEPDSVSNPPASAEDRTTGPDLPASDTPTPERQESDTPGEQFSGAPPTRASAPGSSPAGAPSEAGAHRGAEELTTRFDQVELSPGEQRFYRNVLAAMDSRIREYLAPLFQNAAHLQQRLDELTHPNERGEYPIARAPEKAEARITSKLITEAGNESLRIIEWDLGAGEIIRRRWRGGWSTRFDDPIKLAQHAIDFLAENEDRVRELDEALDRALREVDWLKGYLNPVRRLAYREQQLLNISFALALLGQPLTPETIRTIQSILERSAHTRAEPDPPLSAISVEIPDSQTSSSE